MFFLTSIEKKEINLYMSEYSFIIVSINSLFIQKINYKK